MIVYELIWYHHKFNFLVYSTSWFNWEVLSKKCLEFGMLTMLLCLIVYSNTFRETFFCEEIFVWAFILGILVIETWSCTYCWENSIKFIYSLIYIYSSLYPHDNMQYFGVITCLLEHLKSPFICSWCMLSYFECTLSFYTISIKNLKIYHFRG